MAKFGLSIFFVSQVLLIPVSVQAQDKNYNIWASYVASPSLVSLKVIGRTDNGLSRLKDGAGHGYAVGYSRRLFRSLSAEIGYQHLERNGRENVNERSDINLKTNTLLFGIAFHIGKDDPGFNLTMGTMVGSSRYVEMTDAINHSERMDVVGRYIGITSITGIGKTGAIKIDYRLTDVAHEGDMVRSGFISNFDLFTSVMSISYVFRF